MQGNQPAPRLQALDLVHLIGHASTWASGQQHHGAGPVAGQPHDLDQVGAPRDSGLMPPELGAGHKQQRQALNLVYLIGHAGTSAGASSTAAPAQLQASPSTRGAV